MALAQIPSWLHQPDFLGAIRGGSEAGLSRARITQAADEAAARLRLGYAELGSREQEHQAQRDFARQSAADALKERELEFGVRQKEAQAQHAELQGHHAAAERASSAAQALRERKQNFLESKNAGQTDSGYTLALGAARYGPDGKLIVQNPANTKPVPADKVLTDYHNKMRDRGIALHNGIQTELRNRAVAEALLNDKSVPDNDPEKMKAKGALLTADTNLRSLNEQYPNQQAITRSAREELAAPTATPVAAPAAPVNAAAALQANPQAGFTFSGQPGGEGAARAATANKVEVANKIAAQHPDWTKQQVIDEVRKSMAR